MMKTNIRRRMYYFKMWCRVCWHRFTIGYEWHELENKTMDETNQMAIDKGTREHNVYCKTPDVRMEDKL